VFVPFEADLAVLESATDVAAVRAAYSRLLRKRGWTSSITGDQLRASTAVLVDSVGRGTDAERIQSALLAHAVVARFPGNGDEFVKRFAAAIEAGIPSTAATANTKDKEGLVAIICAVRPTWATPVLADIVLTEPVSVAASALRASLSILKHRVGAVLASIEAAWERLSAASPREQSAAKKRLLVALETLCGEITAASDVGAETTANLARLVRAAGRRFGKSDIEPLANACLALALAFASSRPIHAVSASTYSVVYAVKDFFSALDWNRFLSKSQPLASIVRNIRDAVGVLAAAGRVDDELLYLWRATSSSDEALKRELQTLVEEFRITADARSKLLGERHVEAKPSVGAEITFEQELALMLREARRSRLALRQADDAALARLRITDPASHAEVRNAHAAFVQLLQMVELAGHRRGLALVGDFDDRVEFQPALHSNLLDGPVRSSRVHVRNPAVERREHDGRSRVVVKADVEPVD
jgi:hypothetical protein